MGEQRPLGKTPLGGNPSPEMTYLPYKMEDAMPCTVSPQFLLSFPVLCPVPAYFLHFR